jgi:Tol biopolymer transport system component
MRKILSTSIFAAVLAVGAGVYIYEAAHRNDAEAAAAERVDIGTPGQILVRSTADGSMGQVALVDPGTGQRKVSAVSCNRVYAAAGTAICLRPDGPLSTYQIAVLDRNLNERDAYPMVGVPNRARVSNDGRLVTWTAFVTGDSYNGGQFSTRVGVLDAGSGDVLADTLETYALTRDGRPYQAADVNYWGVTVAQDDRTFYATMSTAGHRYLVQGDLTARTVRTLAENVECPSLSPDGTRIAFKQAVDGDPVKGWRPAVLDLATLRPTVLAETRSVDDQIAWLDDRTVMYALPRDRDHADVWRANADGSGSTSVLVPDAESPAAIR